MWTYVIAFDRDLRKFMMVRSGRRGKWEMPGGRSIEGETPLQTSEREFREETGHDLITNENWFTTLEDGYVHFGFIGEGSPARRSMREILEVACFEELPQELAYPLVEYSSLIESARSFLSSAAHLTIGISHLSDGE
ncbi:MAG: NUDIX domain-containing protein [Thermoplasmatota archaeon]